MYAQLEKPKENKSRAVANSVAQKKNNVKPDFRFMRNRSSQLSQFTHKTINNDQIMQLAQVVETESGTYTADTYTKTDKANKLGAIMSLKFMTKSAKMKLKAEKIGLIQVVEQKIGEEREDTYPQHKKTTADNGYRIDRGHVAQNPIYGAPNNLDNDDIEKTSVSDEFNKYKLGSHVQMPMLGDDVHAREAAELNDHAQVTTGKKRSMKFEVSALVIKGGDKGKNLGSIQWGWTSEDGSNTTLIPLTKLSDGISLNLLGAKEKWNEVDRARGKYLKAKNETTLINVQKYEEEGWKDVEGGNKLVSKDTKLQATDEVASTNQDSLIMNQVTWIENGVQFLGDIKLVDVKIHNVQLDKNTYKIP
ncbi:hypothetical protein [uncultured Shewanella sp.]|uniref:hypothetical protein n=1 Tax=uncultured Shewanella sp. TaxID=173975 RepID=UPI00260683B9|nr:hypothetical protein [uncultured Shewanella sp.]